MSKSLFDVDGNYVGEGGQGFMTQPGVDPTGGGHAKVVTEGVKTMEEETQPQPVANVKPNLVGWNGWKPVESSNGGQSAGGGVADAEKKVEIPRREDRPAAYPTKARRDADVAASVGQELTDEQKAAVQNAGATPSPLSPAEQEAEKKDIEAGKKNERREAKLKGTSFTDPDGGEFVFDHMEGDKAIYVDQDGLSRELPLDGFYLNKDKRVTVKDFPVDTSVREENPSAPKVTNVVVEAEKEKGDGSSTPVDKIGSGASSRDAAATRETGAGNGSQSPTVANGGQPDNGGQSEVPKAEEVKITAESSVNTSPQEVSKDDYDAAKRRIEDSRKKGGIGEAKDKLIIFDYEHPHQPIPEEFQPEEYKPSERPKMKDLSDGYKNVFAIMEQRRRDAMDDPASKAKRAKARRAELIVAALGDLLQVAANMWGAARGATSAKLSSIAGGVKKRHATEDALALKREAQYAKDAEQLLKREETKIKQENDMAEKLYKVAEDARKYNITEKNRAGLAQQSRELQRWAQSEAQRERERQAVVTQHNREVNDLNNHRYRKDEATHRGNISRANNDHATANRIRVKQTPSASKTSSSSSSPSSGSGNTITKKEGES